MPLYHFLLTNIPIVKNLYAWAKQYIDIHKSKDRFLHAIKDETEYIKQGMDELHNFNKQVIKIINEIDKRTFASDQQMLQFLKLSSESMLILANLIDAYVRFSVALKELSVNEYLMENLKLYKGYLYDYVMRVRDTVVNNNRVVIQGEFFRFFKAHEKDLFPKVDKRQIKKDMEEGEKIIQIIENKVLPRIHAGRPRFLFRPKRLRIIYVNNIRHLVEQKERLKVGIPDKDINEIIPESLSPISILYDKITELEDKFSDKKKLPDKSRKKK